MIRRQESHSGPRGSSLSGSSKTEGMWAGFRFSLEEESIESEEVGFICGKKEGEETRMTPNF